jgi:ribosome recycling factor
VIPPPTAESRQKAIATANNTAEDALSNIRTARQNHHKKLRALDVAKKIRPDDSRKAHKQMEEVVKKGNEEVKRILDGVKRVLER